MTNAELIKTLLWCGSEDERHEMCVDESYRCPMWNEDRMTDCCKADLMLAAADALEAAEKRIAELEAQAEHTDQVDAMNFAMHTKQVVRIAELKKQVEELEAQLPKEGEWIGVNPMVDTEQCSICGWNIPTYEFESNYCPNCGARMANEQKRNEEILFGGIENV